VSERGQRPPEQLSMLEERPVAAHTRRHQTSKGKRPRGPRFGEQFDLFPPRIRIEKLDPRSLLGVRSRVAALWRVTIGAGEPHLVFKDRHGLYCEAHGIDCRAVRAVISE
jgi:hypothetical protein